MTCRKASVLLVAVAALVVPAATQAEAGTTRDATYWIEGEAVTLAEGVAEQVLMPGAASKRITRLVGPAVELDLDGDGMADAGVLLVQDSGGSGSFYYVAAALRTPDGYAGTNAVFLGDRIAVESLVVDPQDPARFIVSFLQRRPDQAMSAEPTERAARTFEYAGGALVEAPTALEREQ